MKHNSNFKSSFLGTCGCEFGQKGKCCNPITGDKLDIQPQMFGPDVEDEDDGTQTELLH